MYKYIKNITLAVASFSLIVTSVAFGGQRGRPVTPYGDSCDQCTKYGICKTMMTHEDAKKAMHNYYHKKGYGVELVRKKGRFIRARVKEREKGKVVDVIIFDRRTGRIRSIY